MHNFDELISRGTIFTLNALSKANNLLIDSLQENASTSSVIGLQMIQLQKAILAVGMFSIFDSELQNRLSCEDGFKEAKRILKQKGNVSLENRFNDFILAINVLKHGYGRSYNSLAKKFNNLPFEMYLQDSTFRVEGDVSEADTLIRVDDAFVLECAELVTQVSNAIFNSE